MANYGFPRGEKLITYDKRIGEVGAPDGIQGTCIVP